MLQRIVLLIFLGIPFWAGCDHGFAPPEKGKITGKVVFKGKWPAAAEVSGLYFAAGPFIPCSSDQILTRFNELALSDNLTLQGHGVSEASFAIDNVSPGLYVYSGVFLQPPSGILNIKPIGLYTLNQGSFAVSSGKTTTINLEANFDQLPPFPPSSCTQ